MLYSLLCSFDFILVDICDIYLCLCLTFRTENLILKILSEDISYISNRSCYECLPMLNIVTRVKAYSYIINTRRLVQIETFDEN